VIQFAIRIVLVGVMGLAVLVGVAVLIAVTLADAWLRWIPDPRTRRFRR
jgi:hypothetical protein